MRKQRRNAACHINRTHIYRDVEITWESNPFRQSSVCHSCRFHHGKNGVVCAVHPNGPDGDTCGDWESVPEELH